MKTYLRLWTFSVLPGTFILTSNLVSIKSVCHLIYCIHVVQTRTGSKPSVLICLTLAIVQSYFKGYFSQATVNLNENEKSSYYIRILIVDPHQCFIKCLNVSIFIFNEYSYIMLDSVWKCWVFFRNSQKLLKPCTRSSKRGIWPSYAMWHLSHKLL